MSTIIKQILCCIILIVSGFAMDVSLKSDGPISLGQNVTIIATLEGYVTNEKLEYVFWDNAVPQHTYKTWSHEPEEAEEVEEVRWVVGYPRAAYEARQYRADVAVSKLIFGVPYKIAEAHTYFSVHN